MTETAGTTDTIGTPAAATGVPPFAPRRTVVKGIVAAAVAVHLGDPKERPRLRSKFGAAAGPASPDEYLYAVSLLARDVRDVTEPSYGQLGMHGALPGYVIWLKEALEKHADAVLASDGLPRPLLEWQQKYRDEELERIAHALNGAPRQLVPYALMREWVCATKHRAVLLEAQGVARRLREDRLADGWDEPEWWDDEPMADPHRPRTLDELHARVEADRDAARAADTAWTGAEDGWQLWRRQSRFVAQAPDGRMWSFEEGTGTWGARALEYVHKPATLGDPVDLRAAAGTGFPPTETSRG